MWSAEEFPADAFTFTVAIPHGRYPSFNHTHGDGFRGGRKSAEYTALKRAVRASAHREMRKRIGWMEPARWYVLVELVRLVPDSLWRDSSNLGKAELDALEPSKRGDPDHDLSDPFPGLYLNDRFAKMTPKIENDTSWLGTRWWHAGPDFRSAQTDSNRTNSAPLLRTHR